MAARILAVVDRGSDGTSQQCAELLDFCVGLRTSFDSIDLILRGTTVACVLSANEGGDATDATLSYSARRVRTLLRTGSQVWVDEAELVGLGSGAQTVMDGVVPADTDALAGTWPEYEQVWFL